MLFTPPKINTAIFYDKVSHKNGTVVKQRALNSFDKKEKGNLERPHCTASEGEGCFLAGAEVGRQGFIVRCSDPRRMNDIWRQPAAAAP